MNHPFSAITHKWPLFVCFLAILALLILTTISQLLPQDLSGEEFAVYHYANSYNHFSAWQRYFIEVGRPVSVTWWIYTFEIIGYKPPVLHFLSFVLLLTAALLASVCFYRAWPRNQKPSFLYPLLLLLLFFNWIGTILGFSVKFDQVHLALIFFFLSGLSLQAWSSSNMKQHGWLSLSLVLFLLSLLAYESVAFLYPALLLLSWPLNQKQNKAGRFIALGVISLLFIVLPYLLYRHIGLITSSSTYRGGLSSPLDPAHLIDYTLLLAHLGAIADYAAPASSTLATLVCVYAIGSGCWLLNHLRKTQSERKNVWVVLASLWLILAGLAPFALAGYSITERAYSSAIFGLAPLILFLLTTPSSRLVRSAAWVCALCILVIGSGQFFEESRKQTALEAAQAQFFLDMKRVVPSVRSGTVFIFLNHPQSNNGCGPSFNMLYNRNDIRCAFLSSTLSEYSATRYMDHVGANRGGALRDENWILIKMNEDGEPEIVPEISNGDFGLIVYWLSHEPIRTDFRRIEKDQDYPASEMFQFLENRHSDLLQK